MPCMLIRLFLSEIIVFSHFPQWRRQWQQQHSFMSTNKALLNQAAKASRNETIFDPNLADFVLLHRVKISVVTADAAALLKSCSFTWIGNICRARTLPHQKLPEFMKWKTCGFWSMSCNRTTQRGDQMNMNEAAKSKESCNLRVWAQRNLIKVNTYRIYWLPIVAHSLFSASSDRTKCSETLSAHEIVIILYMLRNFLIKFEKCCKQISLFGLLLMIHACT